MKCFEDRGGANTAARSEESGSSLKETGLQKYSLISVGTAAHHVACSVRMGGLKNRKQDCV